MVSLVATILLILIFWVSFASITATLYYPNNAGKMWNISIYGLSGSEAVHFGYFVAALMTAFVSLGIFVTSKKFKNWYKKFKSKFSK